jgi:hypothetical protein
MCKLCGCCISQALQQHNDPDFVNWKESNQNVVKAELGKRLAKSVRHITFRCDALVLPVTYNPLD